MRISDWSSDVCSSDLYCRNRPASECRLPMPGPGISDDLRDVGARRLPAQQFTRLAAARDQHRRIAGATRSARNIELAPPDRFGRTTDLEHGIARAIAQVELVQSRLLPALFPSPQAPHGEIADRDR